MSPLKSNFLATDVSTVRSKIKVSHHHRLTKCKLYKSLIKPIIANNLRIRNMDSSESRSRSCLKWNHSGPFSEVLTRTDYRGDYTKDGEREREGYNISCQANVVPIS